jgi:signal transduction histidine kinase/CheY-like chemotaxis protein
MNIAEWKSDFYTAFNDAFKSYLNNIHHSIFMKIFLEKIINTTNSYSGHILSVDQINNNNDAFIEAFHKNTENKKFSSTDSLSYYSPTIKIVQNSTCMKSLVDGHISLINITEKNINNEPLNELGIGNSTFYICIPCKFNNRVIGIIELAGSNYYYTESMQYFEILGTLTANLINSYSELKLSTTNDDKKIITYQLLDYIMNTIYDGILIIDSFFDIFYGNLYANNLFGELYDGIFDQNNNTNLFDIFPQIKDLIYDTNKKAYKNKKIEISIQDNKSERILEFIFNTVICLGNFFHLVTIHVNVNDINKDDSKFNKCIIAYLSHELRNPLQSITLASHLVKTGMKNLEEKTDISFPSKLTSHVETINKSCNDMKKIINDILDLSRIEANEFAIDLEICYIEELVNDVMNENCQFAKNKNLELKIIIEPNVPKTIYTDPTRSNQILTNLLSNAIKYSEKGNIILNVSHDNIKNTILFSIIDEGLGIKSNEIKNLFKTYGKTSNSPRKNFNSQGLGLCVSQKIANLLGGHITVKSEYNKGSTFSFNHPVKLGTSEDKYEYIKYIGIFDGNILLVDDNDSNLSLLHTLLEQFNYEYMWSIHIESVNNGRDAIELCKINKYDLIFMDINMAGIDGCTTSKIIKNNGFSGKIVATTGNILLRDENKETGNINMYKYFDDIIIKPFDDQVVLKALKNFLAMQKVI